MKDAVNKKRITGEFKKLDNFLLDLLYPKMCIGCGKEGCYICRECEVFTTENSLICPVCGEPSFAGEKHKSCGTKYSIDGLVSIWDYDGIIEKAIKEIKYGKVTHIANELIERSFNIMLNQPERFASFLKFLNNNPVVTYVPTYGNEFNQAKAIAKEFGNQVDLEVASTLNKDEQTKSQTELKKQQRLKNLKGVFSAETNASKVVLVDDVFTTGATMRECANTLKHAGVEQVWGFTLVRTI